MFFNRSLVSSKTPAVKPRLNVDLTLWTVAGELYTRHDEEYERLTHRGTGGRGPHIATFYSEVVIMTDVLVQQDGEEILRRVCEGSDYPVDRILAAFPKYDPRGKNKSTLIDTIHVLADMIIFRNSTLLRTYVGMLWWYSQDTSTHDDGMNGSSLTAKMVNGARRLVRVDLPSTGSGPQRSAGWFMTRCLVYGSASRVYGFIQGRGKEYKNYMSIAIDGYSLSRPPSAFTQPGAVLEDSVAALVAYAAGVDDRLQELGFIPSDVVPKLGASCDMFIRPVPAGEPCTPASEDRPLGHMAAHPGRMLIELKIPTRESGVHGLPTKYRTQVLTQELVTHTPIGFFGQCHHITVLRPDLSVELAPVGHDVPGFFTSKDGDPARLGSILHVCAAPSSCGAVVPCDDCFYSFEIFEEISPIPGGAVNCAKLQEAFRAYVAARRDEGHLMAQVRNEALQDHLGGQTGVDLSTRMVTCLVQPALFVFKRLIVSPVLYNPDDARNMVKKLQPVFRDVEAARAANGGPPVADTRSDLEYFGLSRGDGGRIVPCPFPWGSARFSK